MLLLPLVKLEIKWQLGASLLVMEPYGILTLEVSFLLCGSKEVVPDLKGSTDFRKLSMLQRVCGLPQWGITQAVNYGIRLQVIYLRSLPT